MCRGLSRLGGGLRVGGGGGGGDTAHYAPGPTSVRACVATVLECVCVEVWWSDRNRNNQLVNNQQSLSHLDNVLSCY